MGSCRHRKRKELGGGICWEAPRPTPCASYCYPGWLGGTRLGLRGQLREAEMNWVGLEMSGKPWDFLLLE